MNFEDIELPAGEAKGPRTSFEVGVPAFDPALEPIGYALAIELLDGCDDVAEPPVEPPPTARAFGPLRCSSPEPVSPEESWFSPTDRPDDETDRWTASLVRRAG
jgi:hypothetical protein